MFMNIDEYKEKLKFLEKEFELKKGELNKTYALMNNPYKVGDVVKDHIGSIKIETILTTTTNGIPCCVYYGMELKKDLTPKKNGEKRNLWQVNIEK